MSALESSYNAGKNTYLKNRLQNPKDFSKELSNAKMGKAEIKSNTILCCKWAQQTTETWWPRWHVSILKKHISLDKEHSQTTQKKTSLMAPLPKSDRAQISQQALSSPGTKHKSSKKAPYSLTCFFMNLISTDTKRQFTAVHRHEKGTQATGAVARDTVPPAHTGGSKPCTRRFGLLSLPCAGSKARLDPYAHRPPFQLFTRQAKLRHTPSFPQKPQEGKRCEFTPPRRSGLLPLAGGGSLGGSGRVRGDTAG